MPTDPGAYHKVKQLHVVGTRQPSAQGGLRGKVAPEVHALLRSMEVKWTSLDVVRVGVIGGSATPLILWIGMKPKSFTCDDGLVVLSLEGPGPSQTASLTLTSRSLNLSLPARLF